jgi:hypothetical protein
LFGRFVCLWLLDFHKYISNYYTKIDNIFSNYLVEELYQN